jgi:ribosomal protein L17
MNKHKISAIVFTLFMVAMVSLSARGGKAEMDQISQSLSNAHNDIAIQESVRKEMEKELEKLENYKEDLVKYMDELNKSYDEVQKEIKKDMPSRLHARRQMLKVLMPVVATADKKRDKKEIDMVAKLFDEIAPKYVGRNGGYTRMVKIGLRKGDAAMEVLLELV